MPDGSSCFTGDFLASCSIKPAPFIVGETRMYDSPCDPPGVPASPSISAYLPAGGPPVPCLPRCLNSTTLKDGTGSSGDKGCYGCSKTDAPSDRCPAGHVGGIGVKPADRWVIITVQLLLIRVSLILFPSPLSSLASVDHQQIPRHLEIM